MKRSHSSFRYFILWGSMLSVLPMGTSLALFCRVLAPEEKFFSNLAAAMVVSWTLILTLYYVWAIDFYTIRGKAIQRLKEEQKESSAGEQPKVRRVPSEWTLGLPPGTVRGTIALTVLVSGMAMMIATLASPDTIQDGSLPIDHFEFLKTAFLMVIAFYFGSKSLEILTDRKAHAPKSERPSGDGPAPASQP